MSSGGYEPGKDKELDAILDTITPLEDLNTYVKAVIYGPFGAGKTTLACTAGKKILYIDSGENGWVSLQNHPELLANIAHRMKFVSLKQLDILGDRIMAGTFPLDIDCVVIDTVSDIQKRDLDAIMEYRCKQDPEKNPNAPTQPDYNENTNRMRRTLSKFRDMELNVVFVSQERRDQEKDTGIQMTRPDVPDKIGKALGQMAHLFAFMEADGEGDNRKRILQVHPTKRVVAKTRIGGLNVKIENPNLSDLFDRWHQQQKEAN